MDEELCFGNPAALPGFGGAVPAHTMNEGI